MARALRALSSAYVERRSRLDEGTALSGAGKRAAFALFYGPMHFLIVSEIVRRLPAVIPAGATLVDLGCGTGAAGAAWAAAGSSTVRVVGVDRHPWAVSEAGWTYRQFRLDGRARRGDVAAFALPRGRSALVAAFTLNELPEGVRETMLPRLLDRARHGDAVLIVEPIAKAVAPWWSRWRVEFERAGGRSDEWRFRVPLPPLAAKLDHAAGLDHHELTARSLWLGGPSKP